MKWTIGRKLTLSFAVVALLMGIIGYFGFYALSQFDISTKKILEEQQPILTHITNMKSDLLVCRLKLSGYVTTGNKAHLQSVNTLIDGVGEEILYLENKILEEEERDILNNIRSALDSYKALIYSLVSFFDKNPEDMGTISIKNVRIDSLLENALLVKLDLLYNIEREKAIELGELSHDVYLQSISTLLLLSIILILMGAVSSFLISRTIADPLIRMAKIVPNIAKGEFGQKIVVKSKDEIGELASAFNQMTEDLKGYQARIREHAVELEKKVEERTKELDTKVKELTDTKIAVLNMMEDMDQTNKELIETQEELKKALRELREADIKKDQFISIAAHELKTPLTSIHGFSQLLQNRKVANNFTKRNKYLKIMDHETKRLAKLVNDILDLSRIDLGTVKLVIDEVDVNKMVKDMKREMSLQIEEKGLESEYEIERDMPNIVTDHEKLTEILINLINNAVKYTPKGKITVKVFREDNNAHFIIKDTGIGIAEENHEKIFERFYQVDSSYTRKASGVGLGLALCKEFIEILGGRIWVKSEEGKGSEFHFTLPVKGVPKKQVREEERMAEESIKKAEEMRERLKKTGIGK